MFTFFQTHRGFMLLLVGLICSGSGCQPRTSADIHAKVSPAKIDKPVSETSLNAVELTEDAIRRLGLEAHAVERRTMQRTRPYGADIMVPTGASLIVSAPLAGTLQAAQNPSVFQVGQRVTEGFPLLRLLPLLSPERSVLTPAERIRFAEAKNALAQSRIDAEGIVQQAKVQLEAARIALTRAERLLNDKVGTARAVDEAQAQVQLAEAALVAAETRKKQVDAVELDEQAGVVESITIPSPLTGIIRSIQVRPGEMVAAASPLFEVMQDESLWVKVPVYIGDLDEVEISQPVRLTMLDGRQTAGDLMLKPVTMPATATPLAAAVDLYFQLANAQHEFQPGQKVTVHLPLKGGGEHLAVPWSAVIHDIYGGQWVYEQVGDRKFVRRRVSVGWIDGDFAAVTRGLEAGVKVVTAGTAELSGTEFGFSK